jgi:DNA-binding LytR/AlgR family response regulator
LESKLNRKGDRTSLRAIVIDNEKSSLNQLKKLAGTNDNINLIASFTDPLEGLANLADLEADVVFLSIDMPEINSFYIAEQIIKSCPDTCIVFVASHDDYALEAFELNALDYLLKPVTQERFSQCIEKLLKYGGRGIESVKKLFIDFEGETVLIKPDDIYYFEVRDKTVIIKTKTNTYTSSNPLNTMKQSFRTATSIAATAPIWLIWTKCPDLSIIQKLVATWVLTILGTLYL